MEVSTSIDFITYSIKHEYDRAIPDYIYTPEAKKIHPINGYTFGSEHNYGVRVFVAPHRPDMGEFVLLSGKSLEKMRRDGICSYRFADDAKEVGCKFTRVDLAIDIKDGPFTVSDCLRWHKEQRSKTRLRGRTYYESVCPDGRLGDTLYVGNRSSKSGFVRIYDKAAEQKTKDGIPWVRVEAQFKVRKAQSVINRLWSCSDKAKETLGIVNAFASFEDDRWDKVFEGQKIKIRDTRVNTGEEKRRDWLLTDVSSAIAKMILESGGKSEILSEIEREVAIKVLDGMKGV